MSAPNLHGEAVKLLIVDDEPFNVEIIVEYLEDGGYTLDTAHDGQQAWEKLQADPASYDVLILDRMMPRMDGMEVLRRVKSTPEMDSMPVIMQTALASKNEVLEGLRAGAYYYLTKPFEEELLVSVVGTAVEDRLRYRRVQAESGVASRTLTMMTGGQFQFQTLDAARDLALALSNAFPEPKKVVIGLSELFINAVEHGNLAISYQDKTELKENNDWENEIARRLRDPRFSDRQVTVEYRRNNGVISVLIRDQGNGFEWRKYTEMDPGRIFDSHGRGIAMSRMVSFDTIEYRGDGNEVEVTVKLS